MFSNVSVGLSPSGPTSLVSLAICCLIPATRISKNSSRFELTIPRNLTRSSNGWVGSCASSRTRRLNSSQLSSRLMKFFAAEKSGTGGASLGASIGTTLSGETVVAGLTFDGIGRAGARHIHGGRVTNSQPPPFANARVVAGPGPSGAAKGPSHIQLGRKDNQIGVPSNLQHTLTFPSHGTRRRFRCHPDRLVHRRPNPMHHLPNEID